MLNKTVFGNCPIQYDSKEEKNVSFLYRVTKTERFNFNIFHEMVLHYQNMVKLSINDFVQRQRRYTKAIIEIENQQIHMHLNASKEYSRFTKYTN